MVLREQTMVQVKSLVKDLGKRLNLNGVQEVVKEKESILDSHQVKLNFESERVKACMGNHLFHSVFKCRFKKVKMMLDRGFDANMKNSYGYSILIAALHIDSDEPREKMFRMLINRGADPMQKDPRHLRNVLSWASLLGRCAEVEYLLQKFAGDFDLHQRDLEGMTCLHHATQSGHVEVVRTLAREFRRFGLSVDVPDKLGLTPYLHARRLGYQNIAHVLCEQGRACQGQGDLFTFRTGREWSELGNKERQKQLLDKRFTEYMQAAILGRGRFRHEFHKPRNPPIVKVFSPPPPAAAEGDAVDGRVKFIVKPMDTKRHVRFEQPDTNDLPGKIELPEGQRHHPNVAFTMLDMTPGRYKSTTNFKHSQNYPSKTQTIGHRRVNHSEDITNYFGILSDQNTSSFRPTVALPTPEPDVDTKVGPKRSTLAILFGKPNKKKARSQKSTNKKKKDRKISKSKPSN